LKYCLYIVAHNTLLTIAFQQEVYKKNTTERSPKTFFFTIREEKGGSKGQFGVVLHLAELRNSV
ncbi:MAG TPA: hypothetical protein VFC74_06270, partial [Oscillospiraceae bacterium]|nr:hypothetical protein [Oscillospiraceae bacterium]